MSRSKSISLQSFLAAAGLAFASVALSVTPPALKVTDGWIRIPPPGTGTTAAYLSLKNEGKQPLKIKSVAVAGAPTAELHATTAAADGAMAMKQLSEIEVAPGATTTLAPGGLHVMIFGLTGELRVGKAVPLTFTLEDGRQIKTTVMARAQ